MPPDAMPPTRGPAAQLRLRAAVRALSEVLGEPVFDLTCTEPGRWVRVAVTGRPETGQALRVLATGKSQETLAIAVEGLVAGHRAAQGARPPVPPSSGAFPAASA